MTQADACLALRGVPCPLNYIRSRLALEKLAPGGWLQIDLDPGEPEQMVSSGLSREGHLVQRCSSPGNGVRLLVQRASG